MADTSSEAELGMIGTEFQATESFKYGLPLTQPAYKYPTQRNRRHFLITEIKTVVLFCAHSGREVQ